MPQRVPQWKPRQLGPPSRPKPKPRPVHDSMPGCKSPFTADRRWRRFRKSYLAEHPTCVDCEARGDYPVVATNVHHLRKRADDPTGESWFDPANCIALCQSCHSRRTARGE